MEEVKPIFPFAFFSNFHYYCDMTNISEELDWILYKLNHTEDKYLLEQVVDSAKSYSASDVHEWGRKEEYRGRYEKIRDLIKVRIFDAVERNVLDRALAGEILKTYYYKPFSAGEDEGVGVMGRKELVVRFV